jgi:hypothetical protein
LGACGFTADAERAVVLEESGFDPLVEFLEIVTEVRELENPAATGRSWWLGRVANGSYGVAGITLSPRRPKSGAAASRCLSFEKTSVKPFVEAVAR